jgi:hypothetical protein
MSNLPPAEPQNPSCGACGAETDFDGDSFVCQECQLSFDPNDLTAEYLDPETAPCSYACDNFWHLPGQATVHGFDCEPCALPAGHTSLHWTACEAVRPIERLPL